MQDELSEKPKKKYDMHSLSSFWKHGFNKAVKKSWDKYSQALLVFGLIYTIAAIFLSKWLKEKFGDFDMSLWLSLVVPAIFLLVFLIYHIWRAPYEIYKEQFEQHELEIGGKNSEISNLNAKIQELQTKIDDRMSRTLNKEILGSFLEKLQSRIFAIEKLESWEYVNSLKDEKDEESNELILKIKEFITKNIGGGEAASFSNLSGIKLANIDESEGFTSETMRSIIKKRKKWLHQINHLDHYSIQLKRLIESYAAN